MFQTLLLHNPSNSAVQFPLLASRFDWRISLPLSFQSSIFDSRSLNFLVASSSTSLARDYARSGCQGSWLQHHCRSSCAVLASESPSHYASSCLIWPIASGTYPTAKIPRDLETGYQRSRLQSAAPFAVGRERSCRGAEHSFCRSGSATREVERDVFLASATPSLLLDPLRIPLWRRCDQNSYTYIPPLWPLLWLFPVASNLQRTFFTIDRIKCLKPDIPHDKWVPLWPLTSSWVLLFHFLPKDIDLSASRYSTWNCPERHPISRKSGTDVSSAKHVLPINMARVIHSN